MIKKMSWKLGVGDDVLRDINGISDVKFASLSIPDTFITGYGSYEHHCDSLGLSSDGIISVVKEKFGDRKSGVNKTNIKEWWEF